MVFTGCVDAGVRCGNERDRLRPISTSANFWILNFGTTKGRALKGGGPEGWRPKPRKSGAPKVEGPKISSFFSLLPPQFSFFLLLFTRQPESPNVHISGSQDSKTPPKFNDKTPKRGREE